MGNNVIKRDELVEKLSSSSKKSAEVLSSRGYFLELEDLENDRTRAMLELNEYSDLITMRRRWSWWVLGFIGLIIFNDMVFRWIVTFYSVSDKSADLIHSSESVLKMFGLAYIIVHFLFSKNSMQNGKSSESQCTK